MNYYFTVSEPALLWLLFCIPLLIFTHLYFMRHARRKAILFGNFKTLERVSGKRLLTKNILLLALRLLVLTALIFAAADVTLWKLGDRGTADVVILVDASATMATEDMSGSRLEAAKRTTQQYVDGVTGVTAIGIVQYSGLPLVLTNPVTDRRAVQAAIDSIALQPLGGTDIAGVIVTGTNLLANSLNGKTLILLTDGVAALSLYDDNPIPQAVEYARERGVVIHTIGIGTERFGSFVPGVAMEAILFDEQNLQAIADATGGTYTWAQDSTALANAYQTITGETARGWVPTPLSNALLLLALCALFLEWGLQNTRYRLLP